MFIATAGWNVPRELRQAAGGEGTGLQKYARLLGATEINSTFYRRHRSDTFARWRDSVPESFRFSVKVPRAITHEAALAAPRAALVEFLAEIRHLGSKLGPVLVQLPASVPFEARRATAFFRILRSLHDGLVACEPRHASWYDERAERMFLEYRIARVLADPPRPAAAAMAGGCASLVYVRWHGSPHIYWSAYSEESLAGLASFARAEPPETALWCVFDNTAGGAALPNALRFQELMREPQYGALKDGKPNRAGRVPR